MIWEELSKAALMGTSRYQLPEEVKKKLEQVGISFTGSSAQAVLEGAAVYYNLQRAGFPLTDIPVEEAHEEQVVDNKQDVPTDLARYLQIILSGRYFLVLEEYLQLLKQYQLTIPPVHLPTLLELSTNKKDIWELVKPLLREKERWLIRQNPAWNTLADEPNIEKWEKGRIEERLAVFRYLRRKAPEQALQLLENNWEQLDVSSKRSLLKRVEADLGEQDEAFLEQRLKDSRKEIRLQAAQLLSCLSGSGLQKRLLAYAKGVLYTNEEGLLLLIMPDSLSEVLREDGIDIKKSKYKGSESSVIAYELIRKIPPMYWEKHLSKSIVDCIRSAQKNKYGTLITEAWASAALQFNDISWIESILRYWWRQQDAKSWSSTLGKELMKKLPDPVFNEMVAQHFRQEEGLIEAHSFIENLLVTGVHYWDRRTSALIINGFQDWMLTARSYHWNFWHYKQVLKIAGYRADPTLAQAFKEGWNINSALWDQWKPSVDSMLRILQFRKEIREKFKANG